MRILLDTHAFLWFTKPDEKLSKTAQALIEDADNEKILSVAVGWEIAIKASLGKLTLSAPIYDLFGEPLQRVDWTQAGIQLSDLQQISTLPFHHKDPFDRLLVAQALTRDIPLVSRDVQLDAYGIERLW